MNNPSNYKDQLNPLEQFLFFISGTNDEMLKQGEITYKDEKTLKTFGFLVIISVCLAFFGAYFLAQFVVPEIGAIIFGFFWSLAFVLPNERGLFKTQDISQIGFRIMWVCISACALGLATSFFFAQNQTLQYIKDEKNKHNNPLDSILTSTIQRQNYHLQEFRNGYNRQIDEAQKNINDAQMIGELDITQSATVKLKLTELRRTLDNLNARYKIDLQAFQNGQQKELELIKIQVAENKKNINISQISKSQLFYIWWNNVKSTMTYGWSLFFFFLELSPCILRLLNQNSTYLAEISKFGDTKGKDRNKNEKRNQSNQTNNKQSNQNNAPNFEDEY